jgi:hypothetical protein
VTRHVWEASKERANEMRLSKWGKKIYARRKETVERSFADAKQHHGHQYARFRGLMKVQMQCLLAAAAQNMKKMALLALLRRLLRAIKTLEEDPNGHMSKLIIGMMQSRENNAIATFGR